MTVALAAHGLSRRFGRTTALDAVSFTVPENTICGLLGRNGAGKTTLMQILTGQDLASSGTVEVFGHEPFEHDATLARISVTKESQTYPDYFRVSHALQAGRIAYRDWDETFARSLLNDFRLPIGRRIKKLSRGMFSALGIVIGLASRAPLTVFDEAHIGLDANSRQVFYDRLLADYGRHPRSIMLSTHLIDEISDLIEHVLVLDSGRLLVDADAEALRGMAVTVTGPVARVDEFTAAHQELHRERLGGVIRSTIVGPLSTDERGRATAAGLELGPVSLQQYVVRLTNQTAADADSFLEATR